MKSRKAKKAQVRAVINRILVVAKNGVDFSFYQDWYEPPTEEQQILMQSERELADLEIALDKAV